ncbi:hypothetical protein ACFOW1_09485 [Parasediminibacterium paludis]|uniref:Uncharacterized protein n=1 Tax=Parasediminibacterium paludis TaxID=908966 RepID=A0ABV8PVU0_9BACT
MDVETPPSIGYNSIQLDYFNAILHALLPSLDTTALAPSLGDNSRQIDYLHAIWQATKANGVLNIPPYNDNISAIAGGLTVGQLYYKPDGSVWLVTEASSGYGYGSYGDGIGSGFLYPSLESLQSEIDTIASKLSSLGFYSNTLQAPAGGAVTTEEFILPQYTLLSTIILFPKNQPLDRITVIAFETNSSYNEVILDVFNVSNGRNNENPYTVNKVYYTDMSIRVYRENFSNGAPSFLFFKAIFQ